MLTDQLSKSLRKHIAASRIQAYHCILHTREADVSWVTSLRTSMNAAPSNLFCTVTPGGSRLAQRGLALGAYVISILALCRSKDASEVRDVIADIPMERIILENRLPLSWRPCR